MLLVSNLALQDWRSSPRSRKVRKKAGARLPLTRRHSKGLTPLRDATAAQEHQARRGLPTLAALTDPRCSGGAELGSHKEAERQACGAPAGPPRPALTE